MSPKVSGLPRPSATVLAAVRTRRVLEFIEANLAGSITLTDLAAAAGLSPYYFTRKFRRELGAPPMRYVQRRRCEMAKTLLQDKSIALVDVALACGFADQSHFCTSFKAETGQTPSTYRRGII